MSKPPYTGKVLDANTLKADGTWASPQAMWDAAYIAYYMSAAAMGKAVINDAAQNPRIPNVQDNAEVQAAGWVDGSFVYAHPPSTDTATVVTDGNAWAASHGGKRH